MTRLFWSVLLGLVAMELLGQARAQVPDPDIEEESPFGLGRLVQNAHVIDVLQVADVNKSRHTITFRRVATLKGAEGARAVQHVITDGFSPRDRENYLEWAKPGRVVVRFDLDWSYVCIGNMWYSARGTGTNVWEARHVLDKWTASYVGSPDKLRRQVEAIVSGQEVVVTARQARLADEEQTPAYRDWAHGKKGRTCRIKTKLGTDSGPEKQCKFVGWGMYALENVGSVFTSLGNTDPHVRAEAAEDLGQMVGCARESLPYLRRALYDCDAFVRVNAAESLGRLEPSGLEFPRVLMRELTDPVGHVRAAAATALATLRVREPACLQCLATALDDPEQDVRRVAAFAIEEISSDPTRTRPVPSDVVSALVRTLGRELDDETQRWSIKALLKSGPGCKAAAPALGALLLHKSVGIADLAADLLSRLGPAGVMPLTNALLDSRCRVRREIVQYLGELGGRARAAVPILMGLLSAYDPGLRWEAALAVLRIDRDATDKEIIPFLCRLVTSKHYLKDSLTTLATLGPRAKAALPAVRAILKDRSVTVSSRVAAIMTYYRLAPKTQVVRDLGALLGESKGHVRIALARALWSAGEREQAVTGLIKELGDEENGIRCAAADSLREMAPEARLALPALSKALNSNDSAFRSHVAVALLRVEGKEETTARRQEVLDVLVANLRSDNPEDRQEAVRALGGSRCHADAALPALAQCLTDEDVRVRVAAAFSLGELGLDALPAVPSLSRAMKREDSPLRLAAAAALHKIQPREAAWLSVLLSAIDRDPRKECGRHGFPLLEIGDSPSWFCRLPDALSLLGPQDKTAVNWLLRIARDDDHSMYNAALLALTRIQPESVPLLWDPTGDQAEAVLPWVNLSAEALERVWNDLSSPDDVTGNRAVWTLALSPACVPFLTDRLKPLISPAPERIAQLVSDLDSESFKVRQKAMSELNELEDLADSSLRQALRRNPTPESRERIQQLLKRLGSKLPGLRTARAVQTLEYHNDAEALRLLQRIAKASPGTRLTRAARAALERHSENTSQEKERGAGDREE